MSKGVRSVALTITLSFCTMSFASNKIPYPILSHVKGAAFYTGSDGKKVPAKVQTLLRGKAQVETSSSGQVKIQWDRERELSVLPDSEVSIPAIAWETGEAPVILLKKGAIRWKAASGKGPYNVALRSDLFEFLAPGADFILSMDPEKAFAEVKMMKGRMEFSAMNAEELVVVESGQKAGFQGVKEEGRIAYDVLLQGRKIPRGKLSAVQPLDKSEMDLSAKEEAAEKRLKEQQKQAVAKAKEKRQAAGQICLEPAAKLDECAWSCQGNPKKEKKICYLDDPAVKCVRRRCNANGEWAEEQTLDMVKARAQCKAEVVVGPCDY